MIMPSKIIKPSQSLFYKSLLILKELKTQSCPIEIFYTLQEFMSAKDFILCLNYLFIIGEITTLSFNEETIEAMKEARSGNIKCFNSVQELFDDWEK